MTMLEEAIAGAVQRTNRFGEPEGEPTTLRSLIVAEATEQIAEAKRPNRDRYGSDNNMIRQMIVEEVGKALTNDLRNALKEETDRLRKLARDQAADVIAETIAKTVKR